MLLRVTQEEKDLIIQKMRESNSKNYVDFIFKMICNHRTTVVDTRPLMRVAGELNAIGVNINQIAKVANTARSIYADEIQKLSGEIDKMRDIVYKCFNTFCNAEDGKYSGLYEDTADKD